MTILKKAVGIALAALNVLSAATASAEPVALPSELPPLNIAALAASDNELFVGGFDQGLYIVERTGAARRFTDPALSQHINALAWSGRERVLWLGTARGITRCAMSARPSCTRVGPNSAVHALHLRRDGELIAGGDAGLTFVSETGIRTVGKKQSAAYRSVWAIAESADGTLFVGATNGLFWGKTQAIAEGEAKLQRASVVSGALPDDWVTALLVRGDQAHVGTYNAGVVSFRLEGARLVPDGSDRSLGYVNPAGLIATGRETLAVATMDGLRLGSPGDTSLTETRARDVTAVVPAEQGGFWIGTRQGLEWIPLSSV